jgi:hypothetical protein
VTSLEDLFMHNPDNQRLHNDTWDWDLNNISNAAFQQYFITSTIADMRATGAQGLFGDSFEAGVGAYWFSQSDPRFAGTNAANPAAWPNGYTWLDQLHDYAGAVQAAYNATPEHFLFIPNVDALVTSWANQDFSNVDGVFLEGFGDWGGVYNGAPSDWVLSMNRALALSSADKVLIMQPSLSDTPDSATGQLQREYLIGTYLLLQGNHTYLNIETPNQGLNASYFPEYDVALGSPVSAVATNVSQYQWDGLYRRDFQNGTVLVNPGTSAITVDLGADYQLVTGSGGGVLTGASLDSSGHYIGGTLSYQTVHTLTVQAGGAAILLKSGSTTTGLQQGGFETPNVGTGTYGAFAYNPSGTAWTFTGSAGVAGNGSGFTDGNPDAPEGTQAAFLQASGTFSQTATFAAGSYALSFGAAQRGNVQASSQTFEVTVDGAVVGTFTPASTSYAAYTTNSFTLTAGSHTIAFIGLDPNGGDNTAFIDNVQLSTATTGLQQGGFETPNVGTGAFGDFTYDPTGTAWTFSGHAGVAGNGSGFTANNPDAPQGSQVAFLQDTGSFSQSVTLAAGAYNLTFDAAQRGNWQASTQTFQVLVDGNVVGTFTPADTSYSALTTSSFTVGAGAHTVTFTGLDPNGGDNSALIDVVQLNPV